MNTTRGQPGRTIDVTKEKTSPSHIITSMMCQNEFKNKKTKKANTYFKIIIKLVLNNAFTIYGYKVKVNFHNYS